MLVGNLIAVADVTELELSAGSTLLIKPKENTKVHCSGETVEKVCKCEKIDQTLVVMRLYLLDVSTGKLNLVEEPLDNFEARHVKGEGFKSGWYDTGEALEKCRVRTLNLKICK